MYMGVGIFLIAVGLILAVLVNTTVGIILTIVGALALVLSFVAPGAGRGNTVIIDRERPVTRERTTTTTTE